jgi:hypothetical protein
MAAGRLRVRPMMWQDGGAVKPDMLPRQHAIHTLLLAPQPRGRNGPFSGVRRMAWKLLTLPCIN